MIYPDAHIHITDIPQWEPVHDQENTSPVCACAHSPDEWQKLITLAQNKRDLIRCAYGIHPQNPEIAFIPFLEKILSAPDNTRPDAIGEAGFDLFNKEFSASINEQETVWAAQLEYAKNTGLPLVVHCRYAMDKLFRDAKKLSQIKTVVFHSFPGSPTEARSFLSRNINAYFVLGKQLLKGNKRAIACAKELPLEVLLCETDAPYQRLKNEPYSRATDIIAVYHEISRLRNCDLAELSAIFTQNFKQCF